MLLASSRSPSCQKKSAYYSSLVQPQTLRLMISWGLPPAYLPDAFALLKTTLLLASMTWKVLVPTTILHGVACP